MFISFVYIDVTHVCVNACINSETRNTRDILFTVFTGILSASINNDQIFAFSVHEY